MLDMGFLPDIRRVLRHLPAKRQTLFFSATMPPPIADLSREMLRDPAKINIERRSAPAVGITQALYPVPQHLKAALLVTLLNKREMHDALVFTRTKHRADRLMKHLVAHGLKAERIHGNRSQSQRTEALAGIQERQIPGARRHRHRGARHRRHGARPRRQLRRARRARGLHPPRRPDRARRAHGLGLHVCVAGGRKRRARDREGDRRSPAARDAARFRLPRRIRHEARDPDCRAHRRHPRAESRRTRARPE